MGFYLKLFKNVSTLLAKKFSKCDPWVSGVLKTLSGSSQSSPQLSHNNSEMLVAFFTSCHLCSWYKSSHDIRLYYLIFVFFTTLIIVTKQSRFHITVSFIKQSKPLTLLNPDYLVYVYF